MIAFAWGLFALVAVLSLYSFGWRPTVRYIRFHPGSNPFGPVSREIPVPWAYRVRP